MDTSLDDELPPSPGRADDGDIQFMLTEFSQLCEFFRHTDSRLYTGVNFYLTFAAAAVTVAAVLLGYIPDGRLYALATLPLQAAVFLVGYFLANQMMLTDIIKWEYRHGLNLVRRFFVDQYEHLAPYLVLPVAPAASTDELSPVRPQTVSRDVVTVLLLNAMLLGTMAATVTWIIMVGSPWTIAAAASAGIVVAGAALALFYRGYARRVRSLAHARRK